MRINMMKLYIEMNIIHFFWSKRFSHIGLFLTKGDVSNSPECYGKSSQPLELTGGEQILKLIQ